jgi:hypothetical protein
VASSFAEQIPVVLYVMAQLKPKSVLDVGKGFGKYGFLLHEYVGVSTARSPDPMLSLKEQSSIAIDGVEIQPNYMWPHIEQLYRHVFMGDIGQIYERLTGYDVVLMTDVIEHLERDVALGVVKHFIADGSAVVISTPKKMFHQDLYASEWETHRSLWKPSDFQFASYLDWQAVGAGRVYLLSEQSRVLPGFGRSPVRRARRFARLAQDLIDR